MRVYRPRATPSSRSWRIVILLIHHYSMKQDHYQGRRYGNYEAIWLHKIFDELFDGILDLTLILFINQSYKKIARKP